MRPQTRSRRSGQAVVMVGVGLIAMSGLMGLAVDLGWSYFVQRMEQAAADAAAMAGVNSAMDLLAAGATTFNCAGITCSPAASSCAGNLSSSCTYATNNGFTEGGDGGRQHVFVNADIPDPSPGAVPNGWAPGVNVRYWVTVRITNSVPQLFSAVLGNTTGTVAARATAAITDGIINGSLITLNRENDPNQVGGHTDVDINGGGGGITAQGPVIMSSNNAPLGTNGNPDFPPNPVVRTGTSSPPPGATQMPDGPIFQDPFRGRGQPPVPTAHLTPIPVPGGTITTTTPGCGSGVCGPGLYFATKSSGCPSGATICASGASLTLGGGITGFAGGSFGNFIFFGGMDVGSSTVNFGPGEFIMAGTLSGPVLHVNGGAINGLGSDAGRIVILTDSHYPGLSDQLSQISLYLPPDLGFGPMQTDKNNDVVALNGLDRTQGLPADKNPYGYSLSDFAPAVIWQDQQNSMVAYNPDGTICTSGCTAKGTAYTSTISMKHPTVNLTGVFYQPRGSQLALHFGVDSWPATGLQMFVGSIDMGGSGVINLGTPSTVSPPMQRITTLVN